MNTFVRHQPKILRNGQTWMTFSKDGNRKYSTPQYLPRYALRRLNGSSASSSLWTGGSCTGAQVGMQSMLLSRWNDISESSYHTENSGLYYTTRKFHLSRRLGENASSKVEVTVKTMKEKQKEKVEEIIKEASAPAVTKAVGEPVETGKAVATEPPKAVIAKKPLGTRIWEELVHYYHGFRLLFIDINISRKLLWRILNGKTLTRRENKLLLRTTSDLFRLIPFSVFLIVPFMELLLPFFIRFFPGMLPSTFQTAKDREDKLKQSLQVRLEMAKFLQKTLDEMAVQHKDHKSEDAKQFAEFFEKIKDPKEHVTIEEIIKFAKRFEDEVTLDSLSREQLAALCRVLELNTMGTSNLLRFQLRVKLRSLAADDRVIAREGVDALDLFELQQACKARGMRAYGLTSEKLRSQLQEWIDLSLNEKVPPTLLLLSRALLISEEAATTHKLVETLRVLPEAVATKTKEKIGESEGKIDNKTKIEVLKEEERKIKEEREEEREAEKAKLEEEKAKASEELLSKVPYSSTSSITEERKQAEASNNISSKDVELLSDALKSLSTDKKMMVEKETLKDLKEELEDYKEDVEELREVRNVVKEPVHESRAAKLLFKKVNSMIGHLDKVLVDLEKKRESKQKKIKASTEEVLAGPLQSQELAQDEDTVHIEELMNTIKKLQKTSDETRLKQIEKVLSKIDADKDGLITVDEVLNVVEAISRENVNLSDKQIEELVTLLDKENIIEAEERLEKAIAKSIKLAEKQIKDQQKLVEEQKTADVLKDTAPELKDNAKDLSADSQTKVLKTEVSNEKSPLLEAAEKQKEKILPKNDISAQIPQQPLPAPPPPPTATQVNPKDKML
ncbi:mitochondrial proton/calcium exchanger protein [Bactrocera dorsalis]|uniref:Mitochondrial proton/calcium exchanger protein n=2 Tax=Bactrocera dorsalis TaxID=27457 RepID=A0A6I9V086_BACDO|nr:mitochondrial proton/calcium exchanger protein [Bactrocera dorsalis]XP_011201710.1 mitochondrial proton/calcium exchanger protein [Bactrocera dorsalis]XP_011201711.1 mitochondrial proton/calcium exchanger protein [Bactrocera dorsalis]XP_011201714.1 mitochondrial proton/calcium exchanger protein [Bactrocera dorsalis]XP_049309872.1 mitochondrial proton/calcium exchanger protein [Bactrocera dorsalis]XP_049309873.1 mitochondrial proton/calcium exchanger protein [Bactrocera dorsalis]XP_04930987